MDQLPVFDLALTKRGRTWRWRVCTTERTVVMQVRKAADPQPNTKLTEHSCYFCCPRRIDRSGSARLGALNMAAG